MAGLRVNNDGVDSAVIASFYDRYFVSRSHERWARFMASSDVFSSFSMAASSLDRLSNIFAAFAVLGHATAPTDQCRLAKNITVQVILDARMEFNCKQEINFIA